ncbi:nucleotidyltransferase family protein [uncultured Sphingomonas sp.]|uniref:nucleotidyltransferase family protein n=1 Tax=uncultured Sphingomonas sp. TaxID=158754 RepID=UPI0035CA7D10
MSDAPAIHLLPDERRIVEAILARHVPHIPVFVFGSRATGRRLKRWSDLDLAILSETPLPLGTLGDLREDFTESDLPWKVDLLDWASTSEHFRTLIAQDLRVLRPGCVA